MRTKEIAFSFLAILLLVFLLPDASHGKVVESKRLEKAEIEKAGGQVVGGIFESIKGFPGWRTAYDSRTGSLNNNNNPKILNLLLPGKVPAEKGTMVWWFYYEGTPDSNERRWECLFNLVDDKGNSTYGVYLVPNSVDNNSQSLIHIGGDPHELYRTYGHAVLLDRKIPARRWSYVAMTWGPEPGKDNRIYLNGIPAKGYYEDYGLSRPLVPSINTGSLFAKSAAIYVGGDPRGRNSFYNGMIGDIETYDEIMTSFNFPARGGPTIKSVSDDTFKVAGISGKLVAGDKVRVAMEADPGEIASFDFGPLKGISLPEDSAKPGSYTATFEVPPGIYAESARITGNLSDNTGLQAEAVLSPNAFNIDSRSRFALTIDKTDLPADSNSSTRIKVKVFDANENPLSDHRIKVTLATTDEYTGLVGGGSTRSRDIANAVKEQLGGAEVESLWKGVTDKWGEAEFDYKAGFAAKTVILQVKDMTSGNVGADYITSYKEASIDIALTQPVSKAASRRGLQYILKVEATRTELTADGRSRSVIRATLLDPNGNPVAGDPVAFSLSSANGELRVISGTTDTSGKATAEYIAGKKIGIVVVSASARGATGSVSITLLADAPAKIYLKARPATLPADGFSRSDLDVKVTDINDNPNKDTKVEYKVAKGGGKLEYADRTTDNFGDTKNRYTAGTTPGIATIAATVRSKVPTSEELDKARNILFVPYTDEGDDIRVEKWLKNKSETVKKGETVLEYTIGRGGTKHALQAPYDCRIDFQYVEYWDLAKTGDTLAQITPVVIPGSTVTPSVAPRISPRRR